MKTGLSSLTLFNAFIKASKMREGYLRLYGRGGFGIAVSNEEHAAKYQRYDHLCNKLEAQLSTRFGAKRSIACMRCGCWNGYHYAGCARGKE